MADYSIRGDVTVNVTPSATMSYGYLNSGKFKDDLMFMVSCYRNDDYDEADRDKFSRNAIVLMAFHLECLSNTLFGKKNDEWCVVSKDISEKSKAIRKFVAKHRLSNGKRELDIDGVQDLFTMRNKVFAHAEETTTLTSTEPGSVTNFTFKKLTSLPSSLSNVGVKEADILFKELNEFLAVFTKENSSALPEWWVRTYET